MVMQYLIPWGRQKYATPMLAGDYEGSPAVSFRREMDRFFNDLFRSPTFSRFGDYGVTAEWPKLDVKDSDKEFLVVVEVPGLKQEDVKLFVENGMLLISGEKKGDKEEFGYSERFFGRFERQIPLPFSVDDEHCKAEFEDGLLTIHLPKLAETEYKKKIPINAETRH